MATVVSNSNEAIGQDVANIAQFEVQVVDSEAPIRWLRKGIADFKAMLIPSFSLGMIYVVLGALMIYLAWGYPIFITSLAAAFLMIGPIVAVGFYCMSCQTESGKKINMTSGLAAMAFNAWSLCCFALVLGVLMGAWGVVSAVSVALFFDNVTIADDILGTLLAQDNLVPFLMVYAVTAIIIAVIAFSISVISAPLITSKKVDFVTAMITSVEVVKKNPGVMLSWALMIAAMVLVGFLAGFIGLAVTLPIVGHASWHAYRELVKDV